MSEFKLSIPYMTLKHGNIKAFYIVWGILGLVIAYLITHFLGEIEFFQGSMFWFVIIFLAFLGGPLYVFFPYQLFVLTREGNRIFATKEGIVFSPLVGWSLQMRFKRKWSDLAYVTVHCPDPRALDPGDYLLLKFKSGGHARLKLDKMEKVDVEQLLMAIEYLGKDCEKTPEFVVFQDYLQTENLGGEGLSYTKIWEDELSRRFHTTSFVPLFPGAELPFEDLKIVQQLAFGGFSAVYIAETREKEQVVIKESVVSDSCGQEAKEKALELFDREAEILAKLNHPQIAKIRGNFTDNERKYMVLDYIEGQNLRQVVRARGGQSASKVIDWAIQMCDILAYLHNQSPPVMHRDFTPDNLVLNEDGRLILVDFGASNIFLGTATGTLIGKQCYMPPEQIRGKPTPQSDLYAMGATLFFLLTGSDPEALSVKSPQGAHIPVALANLITHLTDLDDNARPTSVEELKSQLEGIKDSLDQGEKINLKVKEKELL